MAFEFITLSPHCMRLSPNAKLGLMDHIIQYRTFAV